MRVNPNRRKKRVPDVASASSFCTTREKFASHHELLGNLVVYYVSMA